MAEKKRGNRGCLIGCVAVSLVLFVVGAIGAVVVMVIGGSAIGGVLVLIGLRSAPAPMPVVIEPPVVIEQPLVAPSAEVAPEVAAAPEVADPTAGDALADAGEAGAPVVEAPVVEAPVVEAPVVEAPPEPKKASPAAGGTGTSVTRSSAPATLAVEPDKAQVKTAGTAKVVLVAEGGGRTALPANVAPGKYEIEATFPGESAPVNVGALNTVAGAAYIVKCNDKMGICNAAKLGL